VQLPWYIYLALKQLAPSSRRWGSLFLVLSVLGVALGVAVLVVVQSVMGGFGQEHRARIVATSGHLEMGEGGYPFGDGYRIAETLRAREGIDEVTPFARGFVMVRHGSIPVFPAIYGMDPTEAPVFAVGDYLIAGTIEDLYDDTVFLSQATARKLGVWVGDEVEVFSPVMFDQLQADSIVLPQAFEVVGIYNIEWNQEFLPGILCTLRSMQELYGLGDSVHGLAVRLDEGVDELSTRDALTEEFGPRKQVMTWKERWADFLWVLDLEKTLMLFLNLFIVAVAVFAIAIAQLLMVVRKTREIGLLAVLGGRARGVLSLYCFQGFFIGSLGALIGIGLALLALHFRDPIIQGLATLSGTQETLVRFYYFSQLPVDIRPAEVVIIALIAMALSTIASLLPAYRAARLRPAETLRIEQ
jgi:lipoprotein-releasing system permease protein